MNFAISFIISMNNHFQLVSIVLDNCDETRFAVAMHDTITLSNHSGARRIMRTTQSHCDGLSVLCKRLGSRTMIQLIDCLLTEGQVMCSPIRTLK
jgi:hypothetical protein